ncbi:MAG TPA: O-antigen ligase family protein [Desulfomonilaceae bacterium]|nr:O-antigen ligase family protein [Desulfomonilaceae bacterium]
MIPLENYFLSTIRELPLKEKVAWVLFCVTCLQAAFLVPNFPLVESDRAKLLTAILCAASLASAFFLMKDSRKSGTLWEVGICGALTVLILVSCSLSTTPGPSLLRAVSVLAAGLGGFWCSRILLTSSNRQAFFTWFSAIILAGMIFLSICGYLLDRGIGHFLDVNVHPLACRMLLLAFAPLALVLRGVRRQAICGAVILCLGYVVFLLSGLRSAVLIPVLLGVVAVACGSLRMRRFVVVLIPLAAIIFLFFSQLPVEKTQACYEPAYYRAENYPFSWHIAIQNPLLGIGLRAPREKYLADYETVYPYATKEQFADSCKRIVVSENIFLTFMADLGFPFLLIYVGSVVILLIRLTRLTSDPNPPGFLPPVAILLPLVGALTHFLVLDGLLHPHVSWFFHILLGMIPRPHTPEAAIEPSRISA